MAHHHNGEACSLCLRVEMFQKSLSGSDIKERRVYIPTHHAAMFTYSGQLSDYVQMDLPFYDSEKKLKHTIELRKRLHKCYLSSGWWREYALAKGLKVDHTVRVYEWRCGRGTGERIFEIEGSADEAGPPPEKGSCSRKFDLNKPPPETDEDSD